jgi:rhamnose transport system substrate-binding protein
MRKQRTLLATLACAVLVMAACAEEQQAGGGGGGGQAPGPGELVTIEGGQDMTAVFVPKDTANPVFDLANDGAVEAAEELGATPASFEGPPNAEDIEGQIQIVTNAVTQGVDAVMIVNGAAEQIEPTIQQAEEAGITVVSVDSPIPAGTEAGESLFVAQVNFDETGEVMADMALDLLGEEGGEFAILSATPDASNQNAWIEDMQAALEDPQYEALELVDTVYGNDDPEDSYDQALALVDQHPDLKLIMAPTTVGILAAAEAMQDEDLCGEVLVSGLGSPSDMVEFTQNGCAPEFALWSFADLGYLTYYATYGIATGQVQAVEGAQFEAGRMGEYTIEADPTRDNGLRIVMGPFTVYTEENVEEG